MMIQIEFYAAAALTIGAAIFALESKDIIRGAFALATSFLGTAFLFALLEAPFLALFQAIVYIGAIAVLILFTVMLVRREKWMMRKENIHLTPAIFGAVLIIAGFSLIAYLSGLVEWFPRSMVGVTFENIGAQILTEFWFVLVVLAAVLASSLIGAITLAKLEKEK